MYIHMPGVNKRQACTRCYPYDTNTQHMTHAQNIYMQYTKHIATYTQTKYKNTM